MRRTGLAIALTLAPVLAGCDVVFGLGAPGGADAAVDAGPPDFARRRAVVVRAPNTTTLTDFPLAIPMPDDDEALAITPGELAIRTATGEELAFEVEELDLESSSGADLYLWVRVPVLEPGKVLTLYLHYGDYQGPARPTSGTAVWPAGYAAVWHFTDHSSGVEYASTTGALPLRPPTDAARPSHVTGPSGEAAVFDGVDDTLEASALPGLDAGATSFTYSLWVRHDTAPTLASEIPLTKGGGSAVTAGYDFELGTGTWVAQVSDGMGGFTSANRLDFEPPRALDEWAYLVGVVDRDASRFTAYLDGVAVINTPLTAGDLTTPAPLTVGQLGTTTTWRGQVDEVRLFRGALTSDWIATEFTNLATPERMLTFGSPELLR